MMKMGEGIHTPYLEHVRDFLSPFSPWVTFGPSLDARDRDDLLVVHPALAGLGGRASRFAQNKGGCAGNNTPKLFPNSNNLISVKWRSGQIEQQKPMSGFCRT